jgi:hypothetical protein
MHVWFYVSGPVHAPILVIQLLDTYTTLGGGWSRIFAGRVQLQARIQKFGLGVGPCAYRRLHPCDFRPIRRYNFSAKWYLVMWGIRGSLTACRIILRLEIKVNIASIEYSQPFFFIVHKFVENYFWWSRAGGSRPPNPASPFWIHACDFQDFWKFSTQNFNMHVHVQLVENQVCVGSADAWISGNPKPRIMQGLTANLFVHTIIIITYNYN